MGNQIRSQISPRTAGLKKKRRKYCQEFNAYSAYYS